MMHKSLRRPVGLIFAAILVLTLPGWKPAAVLTLLLLNRRPACPSRHEPPSPPSSVPTRSPITPRQQALVTVLRTRRMTFPQASQRRACRWKQVGIHGNWR